MEIDRDGYIKEKKESCLISRMSIFREVYKITSKIPKGKVTTYGAIAKILNLNPRVVGWAMHANKDIKIPCHRVVDRNGKLASNFAFNGEKEQKYRLVKEGVRFIDFNHVNLDKHLFFLDAKLIKK